MAGWGWRLTDFAIRYRGWWLGLFLLSASLPASVTLVGTRIIYPAGAPAVDLQLNNRDALPYVVTTWLDNGVQQASPQQGAALPFSMTPPVFRIAPQGGQVIRLVLRRGHALADDRESLFYFNFMQIPPVSDPAAGRNQMVVMLRNRVKLFYRPEGLSQAAQAPLRQIKIQRDGAGRLTVINTGPLYATLRELRLTGTGYATTALGMVAPFSRQTFRLPAAQLARASGVRLTLVSDKGANISEDYPL